MIREIRVSVLHIIIRIIIHFPFLVLNFMLLVGRPNFAEFIGTVKMIQRNFVWLFTVNAL